MLKYYLSSMFRLITFFSRHFQTCGFSLWTFFSPAKYCLLMRWWYLNEKKKQIALQCTAKIRSFHCVDIHRAHIFANLFYCHHIFFLSVRALYFLRIFCDIEYTYIIIDLSTPSQLCWLRVFQHSKCNKCVIFHVYSITEWLKVNHNTKPRLRHIQYTIIGNFSSFSFCVPVAQSHTHFHWYRYEALCASHTKNEEKKIRIQNEGKKSLEVFCFSVQILLVEYVFFIHCSWMLNKV